MAITKAQRSLIVDRFYPEASALRAHFDERFSDPRATRSDRFVWDYWHVPGQYTHLRTPAYHFFPKAMYERFHLFLRDWGRRQLGCHEISPPWLSCYVDGCGQKLHGDLPHGPWAYVFSITPPKRLFTGGDTLLMREEILSYWQSLPALQGLEEDRIFETIQPSFNRLTVFDPRIPHGVSTVQGVQDPALGRLVIHGWFIEPRPFIEGPLGRAELQSIVDHCIGRLSQEFPEGLALHGVAAVRFQVLADGSVSQIKLLTHSLRSQAPGDLFDQEILRSFLLQLRLARFKRQKGRSLVTLPLIFESS